MDPKPKQEKLRDDFYDFCKAHPELRFWQALYAWSGMTKIMVQRGTLSEELEDVFYWKGRDCYEEEPTEEIPE